MITTVLRRGALSLAAVVGLLLGVAATTSAQEVYPIGMDDQRGISLSTTEPLFVGGDYMWGVDMNVPNHPYGDEYADPPVAASPVTVVWDWGDGTTTTVTSSPESWDVWCDTNDPGTGYRCSAWVGHDYAAQGLYRITATASQPGALDGFLEAGQVIYDLAKGGTVRGGGLLTARSGGMYDQDFTSGLATVELSAKRRSGSGATTVSLVISVPGMTADFSGGTGMTFTSLSATQPLYVERLSRTSYEVFIDRVFGTVTSSAGVEGTAQAVVHAVVAKGQPTLLRFSVWNTSAGFTYADSNTEVFPTRWTLTPNEDVLSGTLRVSS